MERIVGLEGVRTTPVFLQRHGHPRLELIRLPLPADEGRLPVTRRRRRGCPPISAFAVEDIKAVAPASGPAAPSSSAELERDHDSYRLCDFRGSRASASARREDR
jgi:hypothetical protein